MNVNIGPSVNFYDSKSEFAPIGGVTLGFRLLLHCKSTGDIRKLTSNQ